LSNVSDGYHGSSAVLFVTHDLGVVAKICRSMTVPARRPACSKRARPRTCWRDPRHPYTRALLAATPRADRPAEALRPVPPALLEQLCRKRTGLTSRQ